MPWFRKGGLGLHQCRKAMPESHLKDSKREPLRLAIPHETLTSVVTSHPTA